MHQLASQVWQRSASQARCSCSMQLVIHATVMVKVVVPLGFVLTDVTASTTNCAKKSLSAPTIFDDMAVLAQFNRVSCPRVPTLMERFSSMNLQACSNSDHNCKHFNSCSRQTWYGKLHASSR